MSFTFKDVISYTNSEKNRLLWFIMEQRSLANKYILHTLKPNQLSQLFFISNC